MSLHIMVALTIIEVRTAMTCRRVPRWACRLLRLWDPTWLPRLHDPGWLTYMKDICSGADPHGGACVYVLFNSSTHYIGKAVLARAAGTPGIPSRLTEHLRCLRRPNLPDAKKPRYRYLRRSSTTLRFMPVLLCSTVQRAFAAEALSIAMEAPMGNQVDTMEELRSRNQGVRLKFGRPRRRRPPKWRRLATRPYTSIWRSAQVSRTLERRLTPRVTEFPGAFSGAMLLGEALPRRLLQRLGGPARPRRRQARRSAGRPTPP